MIHEKLKKYEFDPDFTRRLQNFQKLMRFKIRDILLVSSLYDSYLFEEDGRLYELIRQEYQLLNLNHSPDITHVSSGKEALELTLSEKRFDMIITTLHIEDMHAVTFARKAKDAGLNIPIVLLAYDNRERKELETYYDVSVFERIFIWQGDYRLLLGIVKHMEDKLNVVNDTKTIGVQVIILVEDNVKFYSSYLPLIYTELLKQSQRLITEGVNPSQRFLRMRARPKILLCTNYEEAMDSFLKHKEYVLGVISDINFKRNGIKDEEAGIKFAQFVKNEMPDIPILLQSSNPDNQEKAYKIGTSFLLKGSPRLLHDLREFMRQYFSFGDFIFRNPDGEEAGRANNLKTLEENLIKVPIESVKFHAERNHFSNWLKARTEFWLAHKLRPRKVSDFKCVEDLRTELISSLRSYQELRKRGVVSDFSKDSFDPKNSFSRLGSGSLGGKARGLGFVNILLNYYSLHNKFENVKIYVPSAIAIGTDVFDQFMEDNNLFNFALNCSDDREIKDKFIHSEKFPAEVLGKLKEFLEVSREPLAVRSSSLLEDSQYQPFAGVYQTYMIPNNHPDINIRLKQLLEAIKMVYASTFFRASKDYIKATSYRLEEEKMAVVIQKLVGSEHNGRFYPEFAGVAKSYNFYPVPPQTTYDGIALVALGLGKTVVEGGVCVRFCPKYPRHLLQFYSAKETLKNAQQSFFALDLRAANSSNGEEPPDFYIKNYELSAAEEDQTLNYSGSTYSPENDAVYDGISRSGRRAVTFAPILKYNIFPLPEILEALLEIGSWGMGSPIEIEFAVNMNVPKGEPKEFALVQMRPLVVRHEMEELDLGRANRNELLCQSSGALGHGIINDVYDLVVVDIDKFDRSKSKETALEVSYFNSKLINEQSPYILIGVGRWGSLDPWLGIPVTWDQIAGACVIVETSFKDFNVAPSQGSHFFQNITSFKVGYFTINYLEPDGFVDWDWLKNQTPLEELKYVKRINFNSPIIAKINGRQNKGVIYKPLGVK